MSDEFEDLVNAEPVNDNVVSTNLNKQEENVEIVPDMADPAWSAYVMKQFEDDELSPEGAPLVHGLRRVVRQLLGPITRSEARVVEAPKLLGGFERTTLLQPATVEYTVEIYMCTNLPGGMVAYHATFGDAADCYFGNTDPNFARHPTATAATKAEARCLRKALQLRGCAEVELTKVPEVEASVTGDITPTQINFINILCQRNNIDVLKYINHGKKRYGRIDDVPWGVAAKMVEYLSDLQNDPSRIPPELIGYNKNWRD